MSRYKKIVRSKNILKIGSDFKRAVRKGLDKQEAEIYCIEQNPNCTGLEFGKGIYPIFAENDYAVRLMWTRDKRQINRSDRYKDEHIIGVTYEIQDISNGKTYLVSYEQLAKGKEALEAAKRCDPVINGWKEKQKKLEEMSHDKKLVNVLYTNKRRRQRIVA